MNRRTLVALAVSSPALISCGTIAPLTQGDPQTAVSYGYQPLDPVPAVMAPESPPPSDIRAALLDETMRMAIGTIDESGSVTYGPASLSASNSEYSVVIDYIKSTTVPIPVRIQQGNYGTELLRLSQGSADSVSIPVYIGLGLRLTATLRTINAKVNLGNLIAIGAAAQAGRVIGTLVVQTLGITGENISTAIPMPTDISAASIQAAIQAIGTIKAKMYNVDTLISPRVVAVYNTLGGGRDTINRFISDVLRNPPKLVIPHHA